MKQKIKNKYGLQSKNYPSQENIQAFFIKKMGLFPY